MGLPEMNSNESTPKVEYRLTPWSSDRLAGSDGTYWRQVRVEYREGGYGRVKARTNRELGKLIRYIHIIVLTTFKGERPPGMWGLHRDDNKRNNRIDNLYWGTPTQNCEDRALHGRTIKGSQNMLAKLTEADIPKIRRMRKEGMSIASIAREFGVTKYPIWAIFNKGAWAHVPDDQQAEKPC